MSSQVPTHWNQNFASTTQYWSGTDTEKNFLANCATPSKFARLKTLGWIDSDPITYTYNSEGFRDQEFDQQLSGIALGCSHTEGVGIRSEHTWPAQLQNMLGQKVWNLGVGGAALDTCYRLLDYWITKLNVSFVCCAVPHAARYEIFETNHWANMLPGMQVPGWLQGYHRNYISYDQNSELNYRKNLQAMSHICSKYHVPLYTNRAEDFSENASARDLMHCGPDTNHRIATNFFNNIKGDPNGINSISSI